MSTMTIARNGQAKSVAPERAIPRGFSMVEVILAVVVLSVAMLGLAAASSYGLQQTTRAQKDLRFTADLGQVADSLINRGFGNVAAGSATIRGRAFSWTVAAPSASSQLVTLVVVRTSNQQSQLAASDTVSLYLAGPAPLPGS